VRAREVIMLKSHLAPAHARLTQLSMSKKNTGFSFSSAILMLLV